jgi:hypothetical protein
MSSYFDVCILDVNFKAEESSKFLKKCFSNPFVFEWRITVTPGTFCDLRFPTAFLCFFPNLRSLGIDPVQKAKIVNSAVKFLSPFTALSPEQEKLYQPLPSSLFPKIQKVTNHLLWRANSFIYFFLPL